MYFWHRFACHSIPCLVLLFYPRTFIVVESEAAERPSLWRVSKREFREGGGGVSSLDKHVFLT